MCGAITVGIWVDNHEDMLLDMDDNYEVTFGVALWLAVASMVTSVIAFIIPLIPVCVDHDAKKQAIPSGTSHE